jgi:peptidoglycan/xylan/chitin deacetylase (PgdA/CDA1 family)
MSQMGNAADPGRLTDAGFAGAVKRVAQWSLRNFHLAFFRRPLPRRVALYFHHIDPLVAKALEAVIGSFRQGGYAFVNAATFDLDADAERKMVFLSFDDNYLSWFEYLSFFDKEHITATFYCNSLPLDREPDDPVVVEYYRRVGSPPDRRPLRSAQLGALREAGHEIGCHTHSHFNLAALAPADLTKEIELNRNIIESASGKPVKDFSFPFGQPRHFPPAAEEAVRAAGFVRVAHATSGLQHASGRPGTIHRSLWRPERTVEGNLREVCTDGRLFVRLSGRSALG